jgi:hypothetical protein
MGDVQARAGQNLFFIVHWAIILKPVISDAWFQVVFGIQHINDDTRIKPCADGWRTQVSRSP